MNALKLPFRGAMLESSRTADGISGNQVPTLPVDADGLTFGAKITHKEQKLLSTPPCNKSRWFPVSQSHVWAPLFSSLDPQPVKSHAGCKHHGMRFSGSEPVLRFDSLCFVAV